jgi:hypothetical protein
MTSEQLLFYGIKECGLGGKIPMDHRLGDADSVGDRLHGGCKSVLGEEFERRIQNLPCALVTGSVGAPDEGCRNLPSGSHLGLDQTQIQRST